MSAEAPVKIDIGVVAGAIADLPSPFDRRRVLKYVRDHGDPKEYALLRDQSVQLYREGKGMTALGGDFRKDGWKQ